MEEHNRVAYTGIYVGHLGPPDWDTLPRIGV